MAALILTEKFSVASDFAKALGIKKKGEGFFEREDYVITWAVGHLVTLCEPEDYDASLKKWRLETLPVMPEKFRYKPIKQSAKQFRVVRKLLQNRKFSQVIIATDAGREGEVIARTILLESGFTDKNLIKRFWTSQALVPEVVRETMGRLKPVTDYDRLWRAGYYRQVSDWLVGMNCTRVLTVRLKDLFSVGRVQTAVLALLVDRKKQRDVFVPETYWIIKVMFTHEKGNWLGYWFNKKETRLTKKDEVEALVNKLTSSMLPGHVAFVEKQKKREPPPLLFSLTDLQQEANNRYGFPAKKTLDIAQGLYQDKKCLSYPRTDSRVLGTKNLGLVRDIVEKLKAPYVNVFCNMDRSRLALSNKRVFDDARLTDHHALIPFKPLSENSTQDQKMIYDLVLRRFAAVFHPDCEFEQTVVITEFADETFKTNGKVIRVQGWRDVYKDYKKDKKPDITIPALVQGDSAHRENVSPDEKQTLPSPDYTDSLLLKDMTNPGKYVSENDIKKFFRGEVGIGTQSTRAQIIETLLTRNYAVRKGKTLLATDKGVFLVESLRKTKYAKVLTSPEETARWEMGLNRIALGEESDHTFLKNIKEFVSLSVDELKKVPLAGGPLNKPPGFLKVIGACPGCGSEVTENRKAYGCTGKNADENTCGFVIWKRIAKKHISHKMATNLLKYRKSGPFKGFVSKNKKRFSASLAIVQEENLWKVVFDFDGSGTASKQSKKNVREKVTDAIFNCPVCGGEIIEGSRGFGCSNWKHENGACKFVIWKEIYGKKLSFKNMETLIQGKITRSYIFKQAGENKFKAKLKMTRDSSGLYVLTVIPEEAIEKEFLNVMCVHE